MFSLVKAKIDIYSHFIRVHSLSPRGRDSMLAYCRTLGQVGKVKDGHRWVYKIVRVFVGVYNNRDVFHFNVNQLEEVTNQLASYGILKSDIVFSKHEPASGVKYKMPMLPNWKLREDQVPKVDYVLEPGRIKVLNVQTGEGKTVMAMMAASLMGVRTLLTMKGGFTKKWLGDLKGGFGYGPKQICVVGSTNDFINLIKIAKAGKLDSRFIMIPNKLYYMFLQHYELTNGDTSYYGCSPIELCEILGIGFVIRDEGHMEFHLNFRLDLYSHVNKILILSATLDSDSPFLNKMMRYAYPPEKRMQGEAKRFIKVVGVSYYLKHEKVVRCQNLAFKSYSHIIFEQSIMRSEKLLFQYLDFVYRVLEHYFINQRPEGLKSIVFFATVEMCNHFMSHCQYKSDKLVYKRYTQEDPYENLLTADVAVTTLKSAGTAVDIPGLFVALMTDSINSKQLNLQAKGRTRALRPPHDHLNPFFIYLFCRSIPKQVEYHRNKIEIFRGNVHSHGEECWDFVLGA